MPGWQNKKRFSKRKKASEAQRKRLPRNFQWGRKSWDAWRVRTVRNRLTPERFKDWRHSPFKAKATRRWSRDWRKNSSWSSSWTRTTNSRYWFCEPRVCGGWWGRRSKLLEWWKSSEPRTFWRWRSESATSTKKKVATTNSKLVASSSTPTTTGTCSGITSRK